ncbi:MAG: hypothetical protein HY331_18980 [Chloroflexi bacterium]|nr:hypothetical protein [Chloroflexota bacterium]
MQIDYVFLADYAQTESGKMYVVGGGIDRLWLPQIPFTKPELSVVIGILVAPNETQQRHPLGLELLGPERTTVLAAVRGEFEAAPHPEEPSRHAQVLAAIHLYSLRFTEFGDYVLRISIGEQTTRELPVYVRPRPAG